MKYLLFLIMLPDLFASTYEMEETLRLKRFDMKVDVKIIGSKIISNPSLSGVTFSPGKGQIFRDELPPHILEFLNQKSGFMVQMDNHSEEKLGRLIMKLPISVRVVAKIKSAVVCTGKLELRDDSTYRAENVKASMFSVDCKVEKDKISDEAVARAHIFQAIHGGN